MKEEKGKTLREWIKENKVKPASEYREQLGDERYIKESRRLDRIIHGLLSLNGSFTMEDVWREYMHDLAQSGEIPHDKAEAQIKKRLPEVRKITEEWGPDDVILDVSDEAIEDDAQSYMANASQSFAFFTRVAGCFNIFEPQKDKWTAAGSKPPLRSWEMDARNALKEAFGRPKIRDDNFIDELIDVIKDDDNISELKRYRKYRDGIRKRGNYRINAELVKNAFSIANGAFANLKNNSLALEYAHAFYCNAVFRFIEAVSEGSTDKERGRALLKITAFTQKYASYLDSYIRRKMALDSFSDVAYAPYGSELHDVIREHRHWTYINEMAKGIAVQNSNAYTKDWISAQINGVIGRYSPLISIGDLNIPPLLNSETRGQLLDEYSGVMGGSVIWSEIRGQSAQKALRFIELIEAQLDQVGGAGQPKIFLSTEALARASIDLSRAVIIEKASAGRIPKDVYASIFKTMESLYNYLMDSLAGTIARPSFTFDMDTSEMNSIDTYLAALKREIDRIASNSATHPDHVFKREQHRVAAFNLVIERIRGQLAFIEKLEIDSDAFNREVAALKAGFDDSMLQYLGYIQDPELMEDPIYELRSFLADPLLDACINDASEDVKSRLRVIIRRLNNLADLYRLVSKKRPNSTGLESASYGDKSVFYAAYALSTLKKMMRGTVPSPERIRKVKSPPVATASRPRNIHQHDGGAGISVDPNTCTFAELRGNRYYASFDRTNFAKKPFEPISEEAGRAMLLNWIRIGQMQIN